MTRYQSLILPKELGQLLPPHDSTHKQVDSSFAVAHCTRIGFHWDSEKFSQGIFFILFGAYHVPLNTSKPMTMPIAHWRITEANLAVCQTESAASYHGWALIMAMAMVLSWLLTRMQKEDRMCKILPRCSWGVSQGRGYTARLYHLPGCYAFTTQAGRHRQALKFPPELAF